MRELARKIWNEQSAALGVLASLGLLGLALLNHQPITAVELAQIAGPAGVGLGARRRP